MDASSRPDDEGDSHACPQLCRSQSLALLLLENLAAHDPRLRAGKIQGLVDHDRRRGTSHVDTLRTEATPTSGSSLTCS